jgi:hypothetical protein
MKFTTSVAVLVAIVFARTVTAVPVLPGECELFDSCPGESDGPLQLPG